ncbi:MAG TPA: outer membrane beta-barrel protein [Xanthobacteraceae bacterium]
MRRLLAVLGLIALVSPASAADYDLPTLRGTETFVPAFPTYSHWDGFYFGGQLSYGNAQANFTSSTQPLFAIPLRELALESEVGVSGFQLLGPVETGAGGVGGFVGYNAQFDQAIIGLEFSYIHSNFDMVAPNFPIGRQTGRLSNGFAYRFVLDGSGSLRLTDIGELRVRAGYAMGAFMPYVMFGLASGRADLALQVSCSCQELTPPTNFVDADFSFASGQAKSSAYLWGYSGGTGLEWALTQSIFARADYEYIQWSPITRITSHLNIAHLGFGVRF